MSHAMPGIEPGLEGRALYHCASRTAIHLILTTVYLEAKNQFLIGKYQMHKAAIALVYTNVF